MNVAKRMQLSIECEADSTVLVALAMISSIEDVKATQQ
jgi:hypothetical protein